MYEIAAFMRATAPAPKKARKPAGPRIAAGMAATVHGVAVTVVERDARYANAWFIEDAEGRKTSVERGMIVSAA